MALFIVIFILVSFWLLTHKHMSYKDHSPTFEEVDRINAKKKRQ